MFIVCYILQNLLDIGIIVLVSGFLIFLFKMDNRRTVKQIVLDLVVRAEKNLGAGTGDLKYAFVMSHLYGAIPAFVRLLYSYDEIRHYIEEEVAFLNDLMENGVNLNGYDEENRIKGEMKNEQGF